MRRAHAQEWCNAAHETCPAMRPSVNVSARASHRQVVGRSRMWPPKGSFGGQSARAAEEQNDASGTAGQRNCGGCRHEAWARDGMAPETPQLASDGRPALRCYPRGFGPRAPQVSNTAPSCCAPARTHKPTVALVWPGRKKGSAGAEPKNRLEESNQISQDPFPELDARYSSTVASIGTGTTVAQRLTMARRRMWPTPGSGLETPKHLLC